MNIYILIANEWKFFRGIIWTETFEKWKGKSLNFSRLIISSNRIYSTNQSSNRLDVNLSLWANRFEEIISSIVLSLTKMKLEKRTRILSRRIWRKDLLSIWNDVRLKKTLVYGHYWIRMRFLLQSIDLNIEKKRDESSSLSWRTITIVRWNVWNERRLVLFISLIDFRENVKNTSFSISSLIKILFIELFIRLKSIQFDLQVI